MAMKNLLPPWFQNSKLLQTLDTLIEKFKSQFFEIDQSAYPKQPVQIWPTFKKDSIKIDGKIWEGKNYLKISEEGYDFEPNITVINDSVQVEAPWKISSSYGTYTINKDLEPYERIDIVPESAHKQFFSTKNNVQTIIQQTIDINHSEYIRNNIYFGEDDGYEKLMKIFSPQFVNQSEIILHLGDIRKDIPHTVFGVLSNPENFIDDIRVEIYEIGDSSSPLESFLKKNPDTLNTAFSLKNPGDHDLILSIVLEKNPANYSTVIAQLKNLLSNFNSVIDAFNMEYPAILTDILNTYISSNSLYTRTKIINKLINKYPANKKIEADIRRIITILDILKIYSSTAYNTLITLLKYYKNESYSSPNYIIKKYHKNPSQFWVKKGKVVIKKTVKQVLADNKILPKKIKFGKKIFSYLATPNNFDENGYLKIPFNYTLNPKKTYALIVKKTGTLNTDNAPSLTGGKQLTKNEPTSSFFLHEGNWYPLDRKLFFVLKSKSCFGKPIRLKSSENLIFNLNNPHEDLEQEENAIKIGLRSPSVLLDKIFIRALSPGEYMGNEYYPLKKITVYWDKGKSKNTLKEVEIDRRQRQNCYFTQISHDEIYPKISSYPFRIYAEVEYWGLDEPIKRGWPQVDRTRTKYLPGISGTNHAAAGISKCNSLPAFTVFNPNPISSGYYNNKIKISLKEDDYSYKGTKSLYALIQPESKGVGFRTKKLSLIKPLETYFVTLRARGFGNFLMEVKELDKDKNWITKDSIPVTLNEETIKPFFIEKTTSSDAKYFSVSLTVKDNRESYIYLDTIEIEESEEMYQPNKYLNLIGKQFGLKRREFSSNIYLKEYQNTYPIGYPFEDEQDYWYEKRILEEYMTRQDAKNIVAMKDIYNRQVMYFRSIIPGVREITIDIDNDESYDHLVEKFLQRAENIGEELTDEEEELLEADLEGLYYRSKHPSQITISYTDLDGVETGQETYLFYPGKLHRLHNEIKTKSKIVESFYITEPYRNLLRETLTLKTEGIYKTFGFLKSEIYHHLGVIPEIVLPIEECLFYDRDKWDKGKKFAGEDSSLNIHYETGVFSLKIPYNKIPSNFKRLNKSEIRKIVKRCKPFGSYYWER